MTTLNPARSRRGIAAVAVAAALAGASLLAAAPAHAGGGSGARFGGVGEVCGAEPGSIVRVTQSNEHNVEHFNRSWETAIDGRERADDPAGAARLAAQVTLNAGIGQTAIVESGAMTYRAKVAPDGCLVVPAIGMRDQTIRVQAPASKVNGVVEFASAARLVDKPINIEWDETVTSKSPKLSAPERGYTHLQVLTEDIGFRIDIKQ